MMNHFIQEHRVVFLLATELYGKGVNEADTGLETPALILDEAQRV